MGRPFRLASERRQIARPSYGGEREPDSHPTPGPPTFVQSARVQLLSRGQRRGAARGLSVPWVDSSPCSSADFRSSPTSPPASGSPPPGAAASAARSAPSSRRSSRPTRGSSIPPSATPGTTTSRCPGPRSPPHNGTVAHPLMQWVALTAWIPWTASRRSGTTAPARAISPSPSRPGWPRCWPATPRPPTTASSAAGTDSATTSPRPRCRPRLLLRGGQDVVLVRGPIDAAARNLAPEPHEQSANLWWPADRRGAWSPTST